MPETRVADGQSRDTAPDLAPDAAGAGGEPFHALDRAAVLARLETAESGLSPAEAAARHDRYGPNRLPAGTRQGPIRRFLKQFNNLLIYVLLGAGAISAAIGHPTDAAVILAVVIVNAIIGFVQEGRAEEALEAIRGMIDPSASVLRDGRRITVGAEDIVPGDVVLLEAGDRVPADLRLIRARSLRVDEAVLTGESVPADKAVAPVPAPAPLAERHSMAYSGSLVAAGQGAGVAVATGSATELGRISAMIGDVEQLTTPLIRQMDHFARQVTVVVLVSSVLLFAYAVQVGGYVLADAFMVVVGMAVSAIPEGLPAVMTITLAVGVRRMARRNAIIRSLPAVETLGSVSVICTDKTGTLTRNEMTVRSVAGAGERLDVDGVGYRPEGGIRRSGEEAGDLDGAWLADLGRAALLCNDAALRQSGDDWIVDGDPMEGALIAFALKTGVDADALRSAMPRLDEIPFDSRHRYMATLHAISGGTPVVFVKGAPERVLAMCERVAGPGADTGIDRAAWHRVVDDLAAGGQRVIALACRSAPAGATTLAMPDVEHGLTLLGLVGLIDPPREEAIAAIGQCREAGIAVKMITGDHAATARAIAVQLGLAKDPVVLTGHDLDALDAAGFEAKAREASVFARTSPEHKLRLVQALQSGGATIAMTGDGVNDAPALKRADVGVAMGRKGTEAAKEASEMVLADDNFASIVAAVREGRTVYDNITKVIAWTLPTNGGESFAIILAVLFGLTLPVTPVQILWINMVSAVALGLTLAFEPTEPGTMQRPARPPGRGFLTGRLVWRIAFVSVLMVAGAFAIFGWAMSRGHDVATARTLVVNTIVVMEIFYLFSIRFSYGSAITWRGLLGTPAVLLGVAVVVLAQIAFTYLPPLQAVFDSRPVGPMEGAAVVAVGIVMLILVEAEKAISHRRAAKRA